MPKCFMNVFIVVLIVNVDVPKCDLIKFKFQRGRSRFMLNKVSWTIPLLKPNNYNINHYTDRIQFGRIIVCFILYFQSWYTAIFYFMSTSFEVRYYLLWYSNTAIPRRIIHLYFFKTVCFIHIYFLIPFIFKLN